MCVHIYYAYSVLSNLQEKLETLVKITLGYSYSSSYNCFGLQAHKEKKLYSYIQTHQFVYIRIHKTYLLAFAYKHEYSHKNIIITF